MSDGPQPREPHDSAARSIVEQLRVATRHVRPSATATRFGRVTHAGDGVARVVGLDAPVAGELLDAGGTPARIDAADAREARLVLLGKPAGVAAGTPVHRTGRVLEVPCGEQLLGRVVDPLGRPRDGGGPLGTRARTPIDAAPVPLLDREPVSRPLCTGIFVLDTMIPVGRGQRQLVVGDRSTGKSALCLDILANQPPEIVVVYVAIGRRGAEIAAAVERLRTRGALDHGIVVATEANDPPGLIHLAPYAATAMAEHLALEGRDVVLVHDNLTAHAHTHRALGLLLDRPVGREAYPADVFYAHARLLERATQLSAARGGGSLTAFPIVETQSGDLTGFVPTNIVSITDGQVRLDAALAAAGQSPAVDVGLSVSRVGGRAQPTVLKRLAGRLKNAYAQFLELETFARFGSRLETEAQAKIDWGRRVRLALRQPPGGARTWAETVTRVVALNAAAFAAAPLSEVAGRLERCTNAAREAAPGAWSALNAGRPVAPGELDALRAAVEIAGDGAS